MQQAWHWLPAIYLFLGGLGAGSFLVAAVIELTGERYKHEFCPTALVGSAVSGPAVTVGAALLIFDLGAGKQEPWRIFYMFANFSSVMTWGIWILSLFIPVCFLYGFLELMEVHPGAWKRIVGRLDFLESLPVRRLKRVVVTAGSVLAVGTGVYTGVLISAVGPSIPLWSADVWPGLEVPMIPLLFLVSAVSTGMGLTIDLSAIIALPEVQQRFDSLPVIHMVVIGLEAILVGLLLYSAHSLDGAGAMSASAMVAGHMRGAFWVGFVALGLLFPFVVHAYAIGTGSHSPLSGIGSGFGIVVAGLFLRYIILASGIPPVL
jgi:formate-dependent nitrite reductase membrane component NrfD